MMELKKKELSDSISDGIINGFWKPLWGAIAGIVLGLIIMTLFSMFNPWQTSNAGVPATLVVEPYHKDTVIITMWSQKKDVSCEFLNMTLTYHINVDKFYTKYTLEETPNYLVQMPVFIGDVKISNAENKKDLRNIYCLVFYYEYNFTINGFTKESYVAVNPGCDDRYCGIKDSILRQFGG